MTMPIIRWVNRGKGKKRDMSEQAQALLWKAEECEKAAQSRTTRSVRRIFNYRELSRAGGGLWPITPSSLAATPPYTEKQRPKACRGHSCRVASTGK